MPKVILLSTFPLPYSKIGSWPTLYKNYIESGNHQIDAIICPETANRFPGVDYSIVPNTLFTKIKRRLTHTKIAYMEALEKLLQPGEKYVIQLVDNYNMVPLIDELLTKKGLRQNAYLQLFYHGFFPFVGPEKARVYSIIDELVLLTHDSYKAHCNFYTVFPCRVSLLYNGVDTAKFHPVDASEKAAIRRELGVDAKNVFIWCSQDRPKKGLHLILDAWKQIIKKYPDSALLVVGSDRKTDIKGVTFFGKIPNDNLPKYYQAADCYLFPTLCQEGFGLSLIEAFNCGCDCIASKFGGVPEVLQYGKLGKLIENPNFVSEWVSAIESQITSPDKKPLPPGGIYTAEAWSQNMNGIMANAKASLE